jgi:hypothetical protein
LAASAQVDLKALLRGKGEPIERAIAHYLSPLVALASAPRDVAERLAPRVGREGDHDAGLDPVLTPTDAYLQWGDDLSGMLRSSRLVQRFVPDAPPVGDLSFLEKLMDNPRSHMVPERVIGAYEYWLYNHKKSRKGELLHKLVWRPWQDYLAVPIVRRVEELVEEYERIHGRKPPPPWRRTLGGRAGNDPE